MDLMQHILLHELTQQIKMRESRKHERAYRYEPPPKLSTPLVPRISRWVKKLLSRKPIVNK